MSNESTSTRLTLSMEVESGAGRQRVRVDVEGQGVLAERTAERIADLFARAVVEVLPAAPPATSVVETAVATPPPAASPVSTAISAPVPAPAPARPIRPVEPAAASSAAVAPPWFRRNRVRIAGGVGIVLFALAVLVPLLVPVEMRREVLPMPIAFGLVGALSLFSALLPDPAPKSAAPALAVAAPAAPRRTPRPLPPGAPPSSPRRIAGAGFGALFVVVGLIAPFALAGSSADERFLMMLGFAPIAAVGVFLMWVFLRRSASTAAPRAPTRRSGAPASKITGALVALAVMLGVVVLLVLLATALQL